MIDWDKLSFVPEIGAWRLLAKCFVPEPEKLDRGHCCEYEVLVAGDESFPDPARLNFAKKVTADPHAIRQRAVQWLDEFVGEQKRRPWEVVQMDFRYASSDNEFDLFLSGEDPYEEWFVTLHFYDNRVSPSECCVRMV